MRAVIQRVSESSVLVEGNVVGDIELGYLILLGVEKEDQEEDADWLAQKIINLRIFSDENGLMNLSLNDVSGGILVISQFTLHAKTKKGNRPSFINAAAPKQAKSLYEYFVLKLEELGQIQVDTGVFGAMMEVKLVNDGPVTILIDTKNKD